MCPNIQFRAGDVPRPSLPHRGPHEIYTARTGLCLLMSKISGRLPPSCVGLCLQTPAAPAPADIAAVLYWRISLRCAAPNCNRMRTFCSAPPHTGRLTLSFPGKNAAPDEDIFNSTPPVAVVVPGLWWLAIFCSALSC